MMDIHMPHDSCVKNQKLNTALKISVPTFTGNVPQTNKTIDILDHFH